MEHDLSGPIDPTVAPWLRDGGEMGAAIRALDWAQTPIGPTASWSPSLRMMVRFLLANRFPLLLWWGPQYISIYNDAYRPVLGTKHPWALGQPVNTCWSEIWHVLQPLIDTPFHGGPATWMEDLALEINRHGFVEETHFTVAYSPVPDETVSGGIGGVLATVHEISDKVVGERRVAVLRDLGARASEAKTAEDACAIAATTLAQHPHDIPFALLYLLEADGQRARLAGAAGVPMGAPASPLVIELTGDTGTAGVWPLAEAVRTEAMQIIDDLGARCDPVPPGPWSDPPQVAAVVPIRSNMVHQPAGLLVAGISVRLRFDGLYHSFLDLVTTQIATSIANARAYEEERKRAEALAELDRAKTAFFSNVSHEFRTPLTLMLGPLEQALSAGDGALDAPQRAELEVVHRNGLRLLKLVNTLLDFARLEAGRIEASYVPTDLAACTIDLASVFRSAIERAGLRLVVDCPLLPEAVYVDRDMWEKIVLNLLSNAFKFTFTGEIAVRLAWGGDHVALAVRDTGTGIPAHELPHIFERFHRIRDAQARTHEGTGIGLALVQELVRLHGGQITVTSAVGVGTTFTVTIPTGTAHLPADRVGVTRTLASTAFGADAYLQEALRWLPGEPESQSDGQVPFPYAPASPLPSVPTRARILLADDNADMRAYVQRLLSPYWETEAVADGAKALAVASERLPDLVLADVMMPGLDGFALLRALRANPRTATIPVLLLSARAGEEARVEGLEAGADDYLVKPFSARELLARVEAHLTLAQLRREAAEQVRHSAEELAAVVHHSPAAIWIAHDAECHRITGNAAAALLGVEHTANVSQRVPGTVRRIYRRHGVALRLEELPLQRAIATAQPVHEPELELVRPDGTSIYLMGAAVPLFDAHGVVRGAVATLVDCTERKRAEDTVRQRTAQFETLLNAAPLGVYLVDADFRIRQVNPTARLLFGNIPDLIGRDFDEVIHRLWSKEYADEIVRLFRHTLDTGEPYLTPEHIEERRDRGVTEYYEWQIHRLPLPDGRYGVVCYFRDISAQVFARQAIAASEARWRTMFDVTTVGFAVLTPTARFLQLNDAFCRLVGYAREELLQLDADALTHPDDRATMRQQLDRLTAGTMPSCVIEQRYIRKDGALIWVQHSVSLTRDAAGQPLHFIVLCQEVTAQRQAQALAAGQQEALELAVSGAPLHAVLNVLACTAAAQAEDGARTAIFLVDATGTQLRFGAAAGMSEGYTQAVDGFAIGPQSPSCGTAAHTGQTVIVRDVAQDPLWAPYLDLVREHGIRACWSFPIRTLGGTVLGTLAVYHRSPREPEPRACEFVSLIAQTAALLIERHNVAEERQRAEEALRTLNARLEERVQEHTALLALIESVTRAANEAPTSAVALQYAVDRFCAFTGWPVGHVYLATEPGAERWAPTTLWHLDDPGRFAAFQQATQALEYGAGEDLIGRVGARGQPEWQIHLATDPAFQRRQAAQAAGLCTGVAWPLLVGQEVAGVLECYSTESLPPNPALLEAMTQIGTQLGRVIERERATEQAQRQQEGLLQREKLAAMSTMLASVAHELNNPLASIVLQAELLRDDVQDGPLAEPVAEITQAAARCERLVRQFLTLARQRPPERSVVALNTLVAETVDLLAYPLRVDNVTVHLHLDDQVPPFWGDGHQLQQVLLNLLTNAQQALRAAPETREVTCTTQYDPAQQRIILAVADTGPGIPLALQGRIFEPFFTTKPPGVGTGLGLPLCRGIVEAHGGTLEVTSAPGHGATFRLTLPLGAVPASPPAPSQADGGEKVHRCTILVVDDEPSLAIGLARLLRRDGHSVDTVANGRLALVQIEARAYDCILCDVRMPELDGPSLYRLLERQQPHLCQRLIFLTGDTLEPATQAFLEASGVPCLLKPFAIAEARRVIQRTLQGAAPSAPGARPA